MINSVVLVGRLTKDPVLRKTANGDSVVSFTVACNRKSKNQEQTADFINCVAWNNVADATAKYTHKGSLVGAEGRIQTRSYDDQYGKRVFATEVVANTVKFLDTTQKDNQQPKAAQSNYYPPVPNETTDSGQPLDIQSDDLPF